MQRFLVSFRSHADDLTDIHCVDVTAEHVLAAIKKALCEAPPMMESWVQVRAWPWPRGCSDVVKAAEKLTGTFR